jgi:hypothetical protein
VDDADDLVGGCLGELVAGALAGQELGLAHVRERPDGGGFLGAGVDGDDRDVRGDGIRQRPAEAVGVGQRHDDAVDTRGDGGLDELTLLLHIGVALVGDGAAVEGAGRLSTALHHIPERVAGNGVHDEGVGAAGVGTGGTGTVGASGRVAAGARHGLPGARGEGQEGDDGCGAGDGPAGGDS